MNKKIHLIFDRFYPDIGGVQVYMKEAYEPLVAQGWNLNVYCLNKQDEGVKSTDLPSYEVVNGINVHRYSFLRYKFLLFFRKLSLFEDGVINLQEFCAFPHYIIYFITIFLKIIKKKKYLLVLSCQGYFSNDISVYPGISFKVKRWLNNSLGVFLVNMAVDQIHVISDVEKNALINAGVKPALFNNIFYGLEQNAFKDVEELASVSIKEQVKSNHPYLLQVGRMDRHKNYESAIKVLPLVSKNINYIIAGTMGDIEYKTELVDLISSLGLGDRVKFVGPISGIDKFYLMKHALAYIQLSYSEGFGMVVLEAKSQGTLGIINSGTGMEQTIKDGRNGYVVDYSQTDLIAKKVEFIKNNFDQPVIQNMKKTNLSETANKTWQNSADNIIKLITP